MKSRKIVYGGILLALGILLPQAFHLTGIPQSGGVFLPMHIPVMLAGFMLGPVYGALIGLLSPVMSFFLTGMPALERMPFMAAELVTYGMVCGLLFHTLGLKKKKLGIYSTLTVAMVSGRFVYLLLLLAASYLFHMNGAQPAMVLTTVITGIPGIVIQLMLIPPIVYLIKKAGLTDE